MAMDAHLNCPNLLCTRVLAQKFWLQCSLHFAETCVLKADVPIPLSMLLDHIEEKERAAQGHSDSDLTLYLAQKDIYDHLPWLALDPDKLPLEASQASADEGNLTSRYRHMPSTESCNLQAAISITHGLTISVDQSLWNTNYQSKRNADCFAFWNCLVFFLTTTGMVLK